MIRENVGRNVKVKIRNETLDGVITSQCYNAGKYIYAIAVALETGASIILRDVPGEGVEILPNLRDLAEAYLREVDQEEISRLCNAAADRENELDATFKRRLDEMLPGFTERLKTPAPAPDDDVEIIIDPTPEEIPFAGAWGVFIDAAASRIVPAIVCKPIAGRNARCAVLVRGDLTPSELVTRVRKMLAEKEGK